MIISIIIPLVFGLIHIGVLSKLIFFPYPELFIYPYLTEQGLVPYKQILDQHFPGLMFFPINLHTLGMTTPDAARLWQYGIVILTHILLFAVAYKFTRSKFYSSLSSLIYLLIHPYFEGYVLWIDTFMPLLLIPALGLVHTWLKTKKSSTLIYAGIFLGLALLSKQVVIVPMGLVGLFLLYKTRSIKLVFPYFFGISIPVLILLIYIYFLGIWADFFYWTFTFNMTVFNEMGRTYPTSTIFVRILPLFAIPLITLLTLYRKKADEVLLLSTFFVGSLIFAFARFDYVHLHPVLPFVALTTVFAAKNVGIFTRLLIIGTIILIGIIISTRTLTRYVGRESLFYSTEERTVAEKVEEYTDPGDSIFAFATIAHLYQMTDTLPSGRVFVFPFPWFSVVAEERVLNGIQSDPPKVVVRDSTSTTAGQNMVSFMPKINTYVEEHYYVVDRVGNNEIMLQR